MIAEEFLIGISLNFLYSRKSKIVTRYSLFRIYVLPIHRGLVLSLPPDCIKLLNFTQVLKNFLIYYELSYCLLIKYKFVNSNFE